MNSQIFEVKNKPLLKPFCATEWEPLQIVALCPPSPVKMDMREPGKIGFFETIDPSKALQQHQALQRELEGNGVRVINIEKYVSNQDKMTYRKMVNKIFVRDIAGVFKDQMVFGRSEMRKAEFEVSQSSLKKVIDQNTILDSWPWRIEFGDFLILNQSAMLVNVGHRTCKSHRKEIFRMLANTGYEEVGFISLPRELTSLHLDVVCNIAGADTFMAVSHLNKYMVEVHDRKGQITKPLFDYVSHHGLNIYRLKEQSVNLYNTNFINLNSDTILASANMDKQVAADLRLLGINVIQVEIGELEKGAGGVRCLTLPIKRG